MQAVDWLLKFYRPQDVGDPKYFMAALVHMFDSYPEEVHALAVAPDGIPARLRYLNLKDVGDVLGDLYAPIERRMERERIANQPKLPPRGPRTPEEQARVDAQVNAWLSRRSNAG